MTFELDNWLGAIWGGIQAFSAVATALFAYWLYRVSREQRDLLRAGQTQADEHQRGRLFVYMDIHDGEHFQLVYVNTGNSSLQVTEWSLAPWVGENRPHKLEPMVWPATETIRPGEQFVPGPVRVPNEILEVIARGAGSWIEMTVTYQTLSSVMAHESVMMLWVSVASSNSMAITSQFERLVKRMG